MSYNKQGKKARILPFKKTSTFENVQNVSEVTRNLFSDTWHSYLDQVSMVAVKFDHGLQKKKKAKSKKYSKMTLA